MLIETYAKYNARLDYQESFQKTNPVIGILTMDPSTIASSGYVPDDGTCLKDS